MPHHEKLDMLAQADTLKPTTWGEGGVAGVDLQSIQNVFKEFSCGPV